jgi:ATP-binding cassette, subfamily B, multidrug efflux pump
MAAAAQTVSQPRIKARKPPAAKHLRSLIPYVGKYKGAMWFGMLMVVGMSVVGILIPLLIGAAIDIMSRAPVPLEKLGALGRGLLSPLLPYYAPGSAKALEIFCAALVGLVVIKGIFSYWSRWVLIGLSRDIEYDLRNDLLSALLKQDPEFYIRNRTGELMSRCTNDLNAVRMVLGPGIMYSATTIGTMILAVVLMLYISPKLSLWVLIPVPAVAVVVWYFGQVIHRLYERIQASLAVLSAKAQENLAGVRVVRAYAQEKAEMSGFDAPNQEYVGRNLQLISTWSMFMPALTSLIGTTFLLVLWQGGKQVIVGTLSLGELIAFYNFMVQLIFPMIALGFVTNIFQRGAASMGRINYVLDAQPKIWNTAAAAKLAEAHAQVRGEIEAKHLTFAYPTIKPAALGTGGPGAGGAAAAVGSTNGNAPDTNPNVLTDVSVKIPAGSTLAIIGPTGGGKTTLAALIARLWEAPEGTLFIDGKSIREWPLESLRRAIGFVPQDPFLFSETIGENIAFGVEKISLDSVIEAAKIASIDAELQDLPKKYDTMVGERGVTLSGGQKQRTTLARAILRDPKILILDDALSSVDTDTEERILRGLRTIMENRTTILISHRVSTVQNADQIIVVREGRILERGTHDELLAMSGYYHDLYNKQLLEAELERA